VNALEQIAKMLAEATPGPWTSTLRGDGEGGVRLTVGPDTTFTVAEVTRAGRDTPGAKDAALIATLRNHAEDLLTVARWVQVRLDRARPGPLPGPTPDEVNEALARLEAEVVRT
jgi:hypothetical protein